MISDILFDAIEEIRQYQADFDCYEDLKPEIDALVSEMERVRIQLDTPPSEGTK